MEQGTHRIGALAVHVHPSTPAMAAAAADEAAAVVRAAVGARGGANVMFATGNSQIAFLGALAQQEGVDWSRVVAFHMDEYVGLGDDHPAGFARYIRERVADVFHPAEVHYVRGDAPDAEAEARRYEALLADHPLDLVCAGIGENGHLAFNDPPVADFDDPRAVKVVALDERSRLQQVGEGHFATLAAVPTHAITVTIPAVLGAGRVLVVVPETRKAEAVRAALHGPVSTACPASVLRRCDRASLHLDPESAALA
jgi:glucosamine-6-phosphate deaminase